MIEMTDDMKKKKENVSFNPKEYSNSKSISSNQLFGYDDKEEEPFDGNRVNSYSTSNSVSSNQYFGLPSETTTPSGNMDDFTQRFKETALNDLSTITDSIKEGGQKLVNLYKNFFGDN